MTQALPKIRLFVPDPYKPGEQLALDGNQAHYLSHVMRADVGDKIAVFNGHDGEWLASVATIGKKHVTLALEKQLTKQKPSPDLWLAYAPIKVQTEFVAEKATELGVSKILPVFTRHGVVKSVNEEKLRANVIEAAEQCGRHDVPLIETRKDLGELLSAWPKDRTLLYGDESGSGLPIKQLLPTLSAGKYALLVGPEGGFSEQEHHMLRISPFVKPFSMGPRILRADTASVAALACMQAWLGDWEERPSFVSRGG